MVEDMEKEILELASQALNEYVNYQDMARFLKSECEKRWRCVAADMMRTLSLDPKM